MKKKIFIDGSAGTTGLRIYERLSSREDVELLQLSEEVRKEPAARAEMLNRADAAFLCLPDAAAREAVALVQNPNLILLDTSTAHRTDPAWTYGFPELSAAHEAAVRRAKRIAVPGCHASGFIALVYPLIRAGLLSPDVRLTAHSLTGYSGGGKKMIAQYRDEARDPLLEAPRAYGLTQMHKHLPEMRAVTGLHTTPHFVPIVADFYSGMEVTVPLFAEDVRGEGAIERIREVYRAAYNGPVVRFKETADEDGFLSAAALSGKDAMEITVVGNEERMQLVARYDNLGKGASGAALQCLNMALGVEPTLGLEL